MRVPAVASLSTKDGAANKNARMTNVLAEQKKDGTKVAQIRPGLVVSNTYSGIGSGLIAFDGRVLSVVDDTVYLNDYTYAELDAAEWNNSTTYNANDIVWYNGEMWFSIQGGSGQTPAVGSAYWVRTIARTAWDWNDGATYAIGDVVVGSDGVIYYSLSDSNTGSDPAGGSSSLWSTSPPGSSRYHVNVKYTSALNATTPGPSAATPDAAASAWFGTATTHISCATKDFASKNWVTYVGTVFGSPYYYVNVNQWTDNPPYDCSGSPINMGVVQGGRLIQTA